MPTSPTRSSTGKANFRRAQFNGEANFGGAQFSGIAFFLDARFDKSAWFDQANFGKDARFAKTRFNGKATFTGTTFEEAARFGVGRFAARFIEDAHFNAVHFTGDARFVGVIFTTVANFGLAQFGGDLDLDQTEFGELAEFSEARFVSTQRLGPVLARGLLRFDGASFKEPVQLSAVAQDISCLKTHFGGGATVEAAFADITCSDTQFLGPSQLVGTAPKALIRWKDDKEVQQAIGRDPATPRALHPRLLSLRGTDVADLRLSNVDLEVCEFTDAQNLATLRADVVGIPTPGGWHVGRAWPPFWRWTRRAALAEEHAWRSTTRKRKGWTPPPHLQHLAEQPDRVDLRKLAAVYRELRQGRESSKDEPGAEGFYYGEMEMRRLAPDTSWAEWFILYLYWLASGYALRGLRAVSWLMLAIVLAAVAIHEFGFEGNAQPWPATLVYAAGAASRLINPREGLLNDFGQAIRISMGLLGPLLLGLAVLAVRNRIKR
jgi:hypothetical protein